MTQAALKTYNCKNSKSASVIGTEVKKRLAKFSSSDDFPEELRRKLSAQSILDRINKIADNPKSPKAVSLNALIQLGKFRESNLWKESGEIEHSYKQQTQGDIDARYRKLASNPLNHLNDKGLGEVQSQN